MKTIDLNCDLGEGEADDVTAGLMACISSANIACGGHAGDEASMRRCLKLAVAHGVHAGAHPGMPGHFGRGSTDDLTPADLNALLTSQTGRLASLALAENVPLHHIKLHGSLYWATERSASLREAFLDWLGGMPAEIGRAFAGPPVVFALAGGTTEKAARERGVRVWSEAFADRAYTADGHLVPRTAPHSVIHDESEAIRRIAQLLSQGTLPTNDGPPVPIGARTLCVHGDTPDALRLAQRISAMIRT